MSNLISKIDLFISKQVHIGSEKEAEEMGIKLPPKPAGPKWQNGEMKTEHAAVGEKPNFPKTPSAPSSKTPKVPKSKGQAKPTRAGYHYQRTPNTALEEVGHQLSPKGPYRSPEDIVSDVRESQRLGNKISSGIASLAAKHKG